MSLHLFSLTKALKLKSIIIRTDLVVFIQAIQFMVGAITIFHSIVDTTDAITALVTEVMLSFALYAFLIYTMECLACILKNKITESQGKAISLIQDDEHRRIIVDQPLSNQKSGCCGNLEMLKIYTAY